MTWIKIDRDENGFVTEECLNKMLSNLPIALSYKLLDGSNTYDEIIGETYCINDWLEEINSDVDYTQYLPIPKL
jgi:hypothetical protein